MTLLLARLDQLLAYVNRRLLDVPDGLLDRDAHFLLNGVPYETMLGRSTDDPLVRLIARGPAGYRFAMTALLHAMEALHLERGPFTESAEGATGVVMLAGRLRGTTEPFEQVVDVALESNAAARIARAEITIPEGALTALRTARSA